MNNRRILRKEIESYIVNSKDDNSRTSKSNLLALAAA